MSSSVNAQGAPVIAARTAIGRMAEIHHALAASAARIEAIIAELLSTLNVDVHVSVIDLQELDMTRQALEDLGRLSALISGYVPPDLVLPTPEIRDTLNLGAITKAILVGDTGEADSLVDKIELFDAV